MQDPAAEHLRLPHATLEALRAAVESAQANPASLPQHANAVREVVFRLDRGELRVAEKGPQGYVIHAFIQGAINLFFSLMQSERYDCGDFRFFDKVPPKRDLGDFRLVPPGVVRYGAHVEKGAVVMPGYVNIGARGGHGHHGGHLGDGGLVRAGGPLRPPLRRRGSGRRAEPPGRGRSSSRTGPSSASRCIVVEGVLVEQEAVLGAGVVLTATTPFYDVTGPKRTADQGRGARRAAW